MAEIIVGVVVGLGGFVSSEMVSPSTYEVERVCFQPRQQQLKRPMTIGAA